MRSEDEEENEALESLTDTADAHMEQWRAALPPGLARALALDERDLTEEFVRFSATLAYWSERYADAEYEADAADIGVKKARAMAFLVVASQNARRAKAEKHARPTLDALAEQNSALAQAEALALGKRRTATRYKGYVEALRAKRDMLVQLGARRRAELGVTELRIKEQ